jgi:hypothetical protein
VNYADYGLYYAQNNECPACHEFLIKLLTRAFEALGHEWVTAIATAVVAIFTIVLVLVTNRQAKLTHEPIKLTECAMAQLEGPFLRIGFMTMDANRR